MSADRAASVALPPVPYDEHERICMDLMQQRDLAYATADLLAQKVAAGRWIGEHSTENNPWQNALDLPATWCPECFEAPEPDGPWAAPGDRCADEHVLPWATANGDHAAGGASGGDMSGKRHDECRDCGSTDLRAYSSWHDDGTKSCNRCGYINRPPPPSHTMSGELLAQSWGTCPICGASGTEPCGWWSASTEHRSGQANVHGARPRPCPETNNGLAVLAAVAAICPWTVEEGASCFVLTPHAMHNDCAFAFHDAESS